MLQVQEQGRHDQFFCCACKSQNTSIDSSSFPIFSSGTKKFKFVTNKSSKENYENNLTLLDNCKTAL